MLLPRSTIPAAPSRVVITGTGIITALGMGWKANAEGFRIGRNAFRPITLFDVSGQRVKLAAEAELPDRLSPTGLSCRQAARLDRATKLLLLATLEAWHQAQWIAEDNVPVVLGTTAGGMSLGESYFRQAFREPGCARKQPTRTLYYQPQVQARMVLDALCINGPVTIVSNACASGSNAIGLGWELIRRGGAQCVLAGGYDALNELVLTGFAALQSLSPTACRPFDVHRDGLGLGEGAAVVALESLERARRRGAEILGELIGYATTIDQHHLTQPHPHGNTALKVMEQACATGGVTPVQLDYINAHGTGTPLNDLSEALAIGHLAGENAATLPVSSIKANVGHVLGGAGAVGAVACLMALREQWLPVQAEFETPDPVCTFPVVHEPRDAKVNLALSNAFGFGGVNATLIFRRWA
jgi:3-oxoacyl-[acyl-carrier-protein] synthase II